MSQNTQIEAILAALERAEHGAGTLPAKEAVKLRPADWKALADAIRRPALREAPVPSEDPVARVLSVLSDRRLLDDVDPSLFDEIAAAIIRAVNP